VSTLLDEVLERMEQEASNAAISQAAEERFRELGRILSQSDDLKPDDLRQAQMRIREMRDRYLKESVDTRRLHQYTVDLCILLGMKARRHELPH